MKKTNPTVRDQKQFEFWVRNYTKDLLNWAFYKTSDLQSAEDLVQETFLVALQKIESFENKSHEKTWLFGILNNKILEFYKSKWNNEVVPISENFDQFFAKDGHWNSNTAPSEWDFSENLFEDEKFRIIFQNCMGKMPKSWRRCISMKFLNEKKSEEICQELEISKTNYWQIIHRAKLHLRECLEKNWFFLGN